MLLRELFRAERDYLFIICSVAAAVFWVLAIIGTFQAYSPVPFWDMWDGYLNFYIKASEGDFAVWWGSHNEHRIVLSRILFWIDLAFFEGSIWFLLLVNYILLALSCLVFWVALKEICPQHYRVWGLFVIIWLGSWSQQENLTWGFQSAFILAQLLPLSGFFILHKVWNNHFRGGAYFILACVLGVLSIGSMANGVLALPLMTAYAIITHLGWRRVLVLGLLSCAGLVAYFYNYVPPAHHGSLAASLEENPVGLIRYVLLYLGGPIFHIAGGTQGAIILAQLAGGVLLVLSACFSWQSLRNIKKSALELSLLTFIVYVGGTALGTAGGRLIFGVEQAVSSRYMTPVLMAWAALFVILAPKLHSLFEKYLWILWASIVSLIVAILPLQLKALHSDRELIFQRSVAALAVEMGIRDQTQIGLVYPATASEAVLSIGKVASDKNLAIFSQPTFRDIHEQIGKRLDKSRNSSDTCQGHVDYIEPIESDGSYMRIGGWIFDQSRGRPPKAVWISDSKGVAVGYALVGQHRPDVANAVNTDALKAGFKGYFLAEAQGTSVTLFDLDGICVLSSVLPVSYSDLLSGARVEHINSDEENIIEPNQ